MPTQKLAWKCTVTSCNFLRERLQSAFTLANQLRWIAQYIHFVYLSVLIHLCLDEKMNKIVSDIMCVQVLFSYCNVLRKEEGSARRVWIVCYIYIYMCVCVCVFYMSLIYFLFVYLFVHLFLFLFFAGWMLKIQHETHKFVMCSLWCACSLWCVQKWRWRWQRQSPRGWSQGQDQTVRAASPSAFTFLLNTRPIHPNPPTPQFLLRTAPNFLLTSCECRVQYTQDLGREGRGKGTAGVQYDK